MTGKESQMSKSSAPRFAFCEPSNATHLSREHIRRVGPEGVKLGGGVPTPALCGYDLRNGWDLQTAVTERNVSDWIHAPLNPVCRDCADKWREAGA